MHSLIKYGFSSLILFIMCITACRNIPDKSLISVSPVLETEPVPGSDDAADDSAIWIHPDDPSQSIIIGTDKKGGLALYDLRGHQLQYLPEERTNNVDIRYSFPLGNEKIDLVSATGKTSKSIALFRVDPDTRLLQNIAARTLKVGLDEPEGICMYKSSISGSFYAIITGKDGGVEQWELLPSEDTMVDAVKVRSFHAGSKSEGCVTDDELGFLYIAEEKVGIWKYGAEPDTEATRMKIDSTGPHGHLEADVEGLAIYKAENGSGYLLASSQGNNTFVVYERDGSNEHIGTFNIIDNDDDGIDGVSHTDGIEVTNCELDDNFPRGVFVAHDDDNTNPDANQNFKLVSWQDIADALGLTIDTDCQARSGNKQ